MVNPDSPKDSPPAKAGPIVMKKGKSDSLDEDGPAGDAPQAKQKTLPTGLSRAIVIAAVISSLTVGAGAIFGDRYDLVPAPNSANGFMYRIDRLTGAVQFCGPQGCADLPHPEN